MQLRYKNSIDDDKGQKRDGEIPEYGRNAVDQRRRKKKDPEGCCADFVCDPDACEHRGCDLGV